MRGLKGKTAVVIGGAQGIGQQTAFSLAKSGAQVAVVDFNYPNETLKLLESVGAKCFGIRVDVRDLGVMQTAATEITNALGAPTLMVNSVNVRSFGPILEVSSE